MWNTKISKYRGGYGTAGILVHCRWEGKNGIAALEDSLVASEAKCAVGPERESSGQGTVLPVGQERESSGQGIVLPGVSHEHSQYPHKKQS